MTIPTWQPVRTNLPGSDIHGFAMSPDNPDCLYAFVVGAGVFGSADGGQTWQPLARDGPRDLMALVAAGVSPEALYAASMGTGLLRRADCGRTWQSVGRGTVGRGVLAPAVDSSARETVYAGTEDGLYKSADGGATWAKLLYPGKNAVALAISPRKPGTLLAVEVLQAGEGGLYQSNDGGATWDGRG